MGVQKISLFLSPNTSQNTAMYDNGHWAN